MLKKDIEKEVNTLKNRLNILSESDEANREYLSEFLESFENDYGVMRVKTLCWEQIFFKLGKIMANNSRLESIESLRIKTSELNQKLEEITKIINKDECINKL